MPPRIQVYFCELQGRFCVTAIWQLPSAPSLRHKEIITMSPLGSDCFISPWLSSSLNRIEIFHLISFVSLMWRPVLGVEVSLRLLQQVAGVDLAAPPPKCYDFAAHPKQAPASPHRSFFSSIARLSRKRILFSYGRDNAQFIFFFKSSCTVVNT